MQQRNAVVCEQRFNLAKELVVMPAADVLEHAHGDYPVETLFHLPVILKFEAHILFEAPLSGRAPGNAELLR